MESRPLTDFEQVLLGSIVREPLSGYALKKYLAASPAGIYEPSSGALYPALRRLEAGGLLESRSGSSSGRRTHRVYHATETGLAAHLAWVQAPVDPATVARDLGLHLMRFVFMDRLLPRAQVAAFLDSLCDALGGFVADLEGYLPVAAASGLHSGLAIEHGIAVHRASLGWTQRARAALASAESSAAAGSLPRGDDPPQPPGATDASAGASAG